ncbi:MAG: HAD-IIB family hydrolase [Ruminococcaceae bacterium]|nr:HAD-IIB family hydrolase [Oscillospiraceae bacterium]
MPACRGLVLPSSPQRTAGDGLCTASGIFYTGDRETGENEIMALFSDILLTADFDRTLTNQNGQVPVRNLEAIRYFMENGGAFTVNTGRSLPQSRTVLEQIPMNAPFLCYNGSLAIDGEQIVFAHTIDLPLEETLREVCAAFPDLNVDLHGVSAHFGFQPVGCWEEYYAARNCAYHLAHAHADYGPFLKFNVYGELRDDTFYQVFSGTPEEIARVDAAADWLKEVYGDKLVVYHAGARVLNVHTAGVSKLRAARDLQESLGRRILVCVGDAENDLSMLEGADYAFCPGDGTVADRFPNVCPCAEGAVADVIYHKLPQIL